MTDPHVCTCGDCTVGPYDDRCRYEEAIRRHYEERVRPEDRRDGLKDAWIGFTPAELKLWYRAELLELPEAAIKWLIREGHLPADEVGV